MAKRRSGEVELCFDSMTDLITNLAGGLILLVLLLLGVTREAKSQPADAAGGEKAKAGPRPIRSLEERAAVLTLALKQADRDLAQLEARLPRLRREVEDLMDKVSSLAPRGRDKAEEKKGATEVEYRLPMKQLVNKGGLLFYLEDERVSYFDLGAILRAEVKEVEKAKAEDRKVNYPLTLDPPGSLFTVKLTRHSPLQATAEVTRKADAKGETLAEIQKADSRFRAVLAKHSPTTHVVQFHVFPDSFGLFREVRKLAWGAKYDVGWSPYAPLEEKRLTVGALGGSAIE